MEQTISTTYKPDEFKAILTDALTSVIEGLNLKGPEPKTELITRQEAAKILSISLPTLGVWAKQGLIPSYRIGSRVRYKRDEIINSLTKVKSLKHTRQQS